MTVLMITLPILLLAAVAFLTVKVAKKTTVKKGIITHVISLAVVVSLCVCFACFAYADNSDKNIETTSQVSVAAQAEATDGGASEEEMSTTEKSLGDGLIAVAAALAIGLAALGGGFAVGSGATAAIGATAEDPKIFGKAIIFVVLGEAIALYGFVASVLLIFKI